MALEYRIGPYTPAMEYGFNKIKWGLLVTRDGELPVAKSPMSGTESVCSAGRLADME